MRSDTQSPNGDLPSPSGSSPVPMEQLISRKRLAELGPFRASTLKAWASRGAGPPFLKVGRKVMYVRREVEEWLACRAERHPQPAAPTPERRCRTRSE